MTLNRFLIRFRYYLLGIVCISAAAVLLVRPEKNENQSIESMFAMDDDLYASYQALKRIFGGNEVILVVYQDSELLENAGLQRQEKLCDQLSQVDGVRGEPIGIASLFKMIQGFQIDRFQSMLKFAGFELTNELMMQRATELFSGFTHSEDQKTASVIVLLKTSEASGTSRGVIVENLRASLKKIESAGNFESPILMVGEPVMVADGFRMVKQDGQRLGLFATVALSLVVLVAFRSIRWTLIPAVVVQFSLLATDAAVALMEIQVTIVGSMSTSIITVIAVSTTIHLIIRVRRNMGDGSDYYTATEDAFKQLANPITFACLTDAVGFGALWFAELEPVQDFATVMFVGSLLVLFSFWAIVPALALFRGLDGIPFWNLKTERTGLHKVFSRGLSMPLQFSRSHPGIVLLVSLALIVISLIGITRNTIESDFTKNFREGSEVVASYRFVEDNLGGAGVWDIMIRAPDPLSIEFLKRVRQLQDRLRAEVMMDEYADEHPAKNNEPRSTRRPGLTKVLSLVDAIEAFANKPVEQLKPAHLTIGMGLFQSRMPEFKQNLYAEDPDNPGQHFYRIMLRSLERTTSEQKKKIIEQVNLICGEEFPTERARNNIEEKSAQVGSLEDQTLTTGFYVLLTYMIDSVIRDQWTTFGIAASGIVLMLILSLKDFRLALIGLTPNLIPILLLLGSFGWLGVPINLGIALIAAVAIGLSIDSSIHYIFDFQQERSRLPARKAIEKAQDQVGRALVYSTLALIIGFSSLCLSEFLPTVYFGSTAMIAMAGGLIGNLFLLPLFIGIIFRSEMGEDYRREPTQRKAD